LRIYVVKSKKGILMEFPSRKNMEGEIKVYPCGWPKFKNNWQKNNIFWTLILKLILLISEKNIKSEQLIFENQNFYFKMSEFIKYF